MALNLARTRRIHAQHVRRSTHRPLERDIPSVNLHVKGIHFLEHSSGVGPNPSRTEMEDENTDPQTDSNIRFQVAIRGWSDRNQQTRAETLLALAAEKMVKSLQLRREILLIPRDWWPDPHNTLGPEEPGWWYTVSREMWYQGCSSCKNRIGKDHQDADRCPECPVKIKKRKNPGSKKSQGKNQKGRSEHASNRPQRSERVHNYAEPPDDPMNEDSEEAPDNDSGDMQEGYLCTSADPRRVGVGGGEPMILNPKDIRQILTLQQTTEDQTIWMTSTQTGFPLERDEEEVTNSRDVQMGRHTARYLHPSISAYIADWETDLASTGTQPPPLVQAVVDLENEWSQKYVIGNWVAPTEPSPPSVIWHHDPPPLMTHHPTRVTDSNIRITLREDSLNEALPTSDNGLGWVQIQQKSLRWEENIQGSTVITHEGLTTLDHPTQGWTIASGTWNALRAKWGLTSETLQRIYESFFPKTTKNKDIWWESKTSLITPRDESENESGETEAWDPFDEQEEEGYRKTTAYIWDSMDEEDREDTMDTLKQSDEWVIWKSKDKWTTLLQAAGFHQLLYIKKDIQEDCWGSKIKGWWRTRDIRVKKPKKTYECWVKSKTKIPPGAQDAMITALQAPNHNFGKDEYVIDMMGHEAHYWQGTELGLLGAFEFKGACTAGDGSCDTGSKSMGAGFCNLGQLGWNTQTPLPLSDLHEQRTRNSRKVGREDEGVSSTRPEMVALAEYLEDHDDDINLLYLTDSEAILQAIHRWIGCGAKLNLSKSPDVDVLKRIIIKLQKRVLVGAVTLLVKVKAHRGDPLNEEADIRTEMGRHKEIKEVGWNDPTNRTIYRWKVGQITRSTAWTNTVRNRFRQEAGEIEAFRALEIGAAKWCKEHIPRKGNNLNDITEEGISLWWEKQNLLWACHVSRSKDRMNNDGSFVTHQVGAISSTFTSDWYLRKGESRDKMGEWLKKATVRSQDQRRMLQANTHSFPSNYWRNKITKGKESNKCDLCRALWIDEGRFNTEDELPIQTLGHIQHQCEARSEVHTLAHHRCWRIIHVEFGRLASSKW